MEGTVCVKSYPAPPFDHREALRYAGVRGEQPEISALLDECFSEAEKALSYRVCWREFAICRKGDCLDLGFMTTPSSDLRKNLEGCDRVVVFGATVGLGLDRLISRYGRISETRALMFQAIGAERIESLCNVFNTEISEHYNQNGYFTCPRFSPGYGDLPLETQREFFAALDCSRKIGLTLNGSLLMSPTKSVTAIIGIGLSERTDSETFACERCGRKDCVFGEHYENN